MLHPRGSERPRRRISHREHEEYFFQSTKISKEASTFNSADQATNRCSSSLRTARSIATLRRTSSTLVDCLLTKLDDSGGEVTSLPTRRLSPDERARKARELLTRSHQDVG